MKTYKVAITETLQRIVYVDASDYQGTEIEVVENDN